MLKRILCIIITAAIGLTVALSLGAVPVSAATTAASITTSSSSVEGTEMELTVTVKYSVTGANIGAIDATLDYNSSVFTYDSSETGSASGLGVRGDGGKVTLSYYNANGGASVTATMKFMSKAVGKSDFKLTTISFVDTEAKALPIPSDKTASVSVVERQKSSNANLKSVSIGVGDKSGKALKYTLLPGFSASTTTYTLKVPYETDTVTINGTVADSKAKCATSGDYKITGDKGQKKVTVTAENGTVKVYIFNIVREAKTTSSTTPAPTPSAPSDSSTPDTSVPSDSSGELTVIVGSEEMTVATDITDITFKDGFTLSVSSLNGTEIPVFESSDGKTVVAILDNGKKKETYIYRKETIEFIKPTVFKSGDNEYILDSPQYYAEQPSGTMLCNVTVNGSELSGFTASEFGDFVLVWAVKLGKGALYSYDTVENTLQRYNGSSPSGVASNNASTVVKVDPLTESRSVRLTTFALVTAALSVVILVLLVAFLLQAGRLKNAAEPTAPSYSLERFAARSDESHESEKSEDTPESNDESS